VKYCRQLLVALSLVTLPAWAAEPEEGPAVQTSPAAAPAPASAAATPPAQSATPPAVNAPVSRAQDRIELDTTQITGNRELPRVLYVVPWKRPDLGDLTGRPANSLLDEVLSPVDRDVFRRQNRYYNALKPDSATSESPGPAEGEK
jgi:hypothetical protein